METALPSLTALRALDAVLRHGSLSAAGRELGVTPAAISHRLRDLETLAGQPLLWRNGRRFEATEAGAQVMTALGDAFQKLREAATALRGLRSGVAVRVLAPAGFTALWLLPRLAGFEKRHPDVIPYVATSAAHQQGGAAPDLRIAQGVQPPDGRGWALLAEDVTVLAHAPRRFPEAAKLLLTLSTRKALHVDGPKGSRLDWPGWMAAMGLPGPAPRGPQVATEPAAAELAMQGEALLLTSLFPLADRVAAGRLVVVPGTAVDAGLRYWLMVERPSPAALALVDWLKAEVEAHRRDAMAGALALAGVVRTLGHGGDEVSP